MQLAAYLSREGLKAGEFAAHLGIDDSMMSRVLAGRRKPSLTLAVRIETATGGLVPPREFVPEFALQTPESAAVPPGGAPASPPDVPASGGEAESRPALRAFAGAEGA